LRTGTEGEGFDVVAIAGAHGGARAVSRASGEPPARMTAISARRARVRGDFSSIIDANSPHPAST
jgi:hypothetical protein